MKYLVILISLLVFGTLAAQTVGDSSSATPINLTVLQYKERTIRTDKLVLVNLQADWCIVCKKEKPILAQIGLEYKNEVEIIEIDLDDNPLIAEYFEVDGLPVNLLYKQGNLIWNRMGLINKQEASSMIRAASAK